MQTFIDKAYTYVFLYIYEIHIYYTGKIFGFKGTIDVNTDFYFYNFN